MMRKKTHEASTRPRLLVLVDESNIGSSVRTAGRGLDWLKLRDFLAGPDTGRDLIEMVVYAGLPPAIPIWQEERDKKNKFMQWLRSNGFMVVTKDGAPADDGHVFARTAKSQGTRPPHSAARSRIVRGVRRDTHAPIAKRF